MEAMCGSMMAALDVAKALMTTHPELETVLLVSGYRNNDLIDPAVPETRFMLDIGSGGSALVLKKNAGRNAILASAFPVRVHPRPAGVPVLGRAGLQGQAGRGDHAQLLRRDPRVIEAVWPV